MDCQTHMNERNLLVSAIALRYWELAKVATTDSKELLSGLLKKIIPKTKDHRVIDDGTTMDNLKNLATFLNYLLQTNEPQDYAMTKQTLRLNIKEDNELYAVALESINPEKSKEEVETMCHAHIRSIMYFFETQEFFNIVKKKVTSIAYGDRTDSIMDQARDIIEAIMPYANTGKGDGGIGIKNPMVVAGFSTEELDSIEDVWEKGQTKTSPDSILKTGYQGVNRLLGEPGGFFRGDTVLLGALQHNYKSGMLNDIMMDLCHYNKPYFFTNKDKAAVIHISFENFAEDDLTRIYKRAYLINHGRHPTLEEILATDKQVVARTIEEYIGINGFKYFYVRVNPSDVSYHDIQRMVLEFESKGYEIHALAIDYLAMIQPKGIPKLGGGAEWQELFKLMRNFCSERDITLFTPHQLSVDATYLNREGYESDFVNTVAGKSYWAKSKQIDREVDVEIVQHIVRLNTHDGVKSYLTMAIGKNRRVHNTKAEHKNCALPLTDYGLLPDLEGEPTFIPDVKKLRKIGSMSGEEDTW